MNDFNPSLEQLRNQPVVFDPTSFSGRDQFGQREDALPRTIPRTVTASTTSNPLDDEIRADTSAGSITISLESAIACDGRRKLFKKLVAANNLILDGNGSETIDGSSTVTLSAQFSVAKIISNGAGWDIEYLGPAQPSSGGGTVIFSGNVNTGSAVTVSAGAAFSKIVITGNALSTNTAARIPIIQVNLDATAGNYDGQHGIGGVLADTTLASVVQSPVIGAASTFNFVATLENADGTGGFMKYSASAVDSTGARSFTEGIYTGSVNAIVQIVFLINGSGVFDGAGTATVKGYL